MNIFQILNVDNFYAESEEIEIAKGKYEYPDTWKKIINNFKRQYRWGKK